MFGRIWKSDGLNGVRGRTVCVGGRRALARGGGG